MKFSTHFFTLLAVSFAFSHSIPNQKRDDSDLDNFIENMVNDTVFEVTKDTSDSDSKKTNKWLSNSSEEYKACEEALKQYEECFEDKEITKENVDVVCNTPISEKCQKLYNDGIDVIPECQKLEGLRKTVLGHIVKLSDLNIKVKCSKDEQGQYCPLNYFSVSEKNYIGFRIVSNNEEQFKAALDDTCKSDICTDVYLNAFTEFSDLKNDVSSFFSSIGEEITSTISDKISSKDKRETEDQKIEDDKLLNKTSDYLKSDKCIALKAKYENLTSDASSSFKTRDRKSVV